MIEEKEGIGESQELGDTTVTLEGYQFIEFTPNDIEASRLEDYNDVVLLTVKFGMYGDVYYSSSATHKLVRSVPIKIIW